MRSGVTNSLYGLGLGWVPWLGVSPTREQPPAGAAIPVWPVSQIPALRRCKGRKTRGFAPRKAVHRLRAWLFLVARSATQRPACSHPTSDRANRGAGWAPSFQLALSSFESLARAIAWLPPAVVVGRCGQPPPAARPNYSLRHAAPPQTPTTSDATPCPLSLQMGRALRIRKMPTCMGSRALPWMPSVRSNHLLFFGEEIDIKV
jgi:hypothetical protein